MSWELLARAPFVTSPNELLPATTQISFSHLAQPSWDDDVAKRLWLDDWRPSSLE